MDDIKMTCQKCGETHPENQVEDSHDVPVYLFNGLTRNERKNKADKWGRHNLCKRCHDIYEKIIPSIIVQDCDEIQLEKLRNKVKSFAKKYFKEGTHGTTP